MFVSNDAKQKNHFVKAQKYYEAVIDIAEGKELGEAYFELSQMFMNISFPYSASGTNASHILDLIVRSAQLGMSTWIVDH
jgi:hypothetical protein